MGTAGRPFYQCKAHDSGDAGTRRLLVPEEKEL
jgi:hypothetical protein